MKSKDISTIPGFESYSGYTIFEDGSIISHLKRVAHATGFETVIDPLFCKKLKPFPNKKGYLSVCIRGKHVRVHRLVALAFIPNPDNKPQINHKDCNKNNNSVSNLEWCTNSYNHAHKMAHGLNVVPKGDQHYTHLRNYKPGEHHSCRAVNQFTLDGNFIKEFPSVVYAGKACGVDYTNISKCCNGHTKSAGGYRWKYRESSTTIY